MARSLAPYSHRPNVEAESGFVDVRELRALSERPLFDALAAPMRELDGSGLAALNQHHGEGRTASGQRIRFVGPDADPIGYEARVYERGEVVTRSGSWHDLFNALVWCRFPRTKAALNALHVDEIGTGSPASGRSARRDAATQFDESGLVVLSADPVLSELLSARRWVELFWGRRAEVIRDMRFVGFGHGLYDALRAPFYGLCGRAALIDVDRALVESSIDVQVAHADDVLAERFGQRPWYPSAKCFCPVPVLGIPGATADSESRAYYEDERQFRPPGRHRSQVAS